MKQSKILNRDFSAEGATEILSLGDIKEHLFIDSGNTSFDDDLTRLNTQVRRYAEEITGLSLIDRTVTLYVYYLSPFILPYGPMTTFSSAYIKTGINEYTVQTNNDDYEIVSNVFHSYVGGELWKLVYDAGYTSATCPEGLKLAMLNEIARRFENRGEKVIISDTNELLQPYKLLEWVI